MSLWLVWSISGVGIHCLNYQEFNYVCRCFLNLLGWKGRAFCYLCNGPMTAHAPCEQAAISRCFCCPSSAALPTHPRREGSEEIGLHLLSDDYLCILYFHMYSDEGLDDRSCIFWPQPFALLGKCKHHCCLLPFVFLLFLSLVLSMLVGVHRVHLLD